MIQQHHTPDGIIEVEVPDPDRDRLIEICASSPDVMTQVEIWEAIRILARLAGYHHPDS